MPKKIMELFSIIKELGFQKKNNIKDCLFATGGKLENEPDLSYRKSGSAALDMAYVAAGRYDGYFQKSFKSLGYCSRYYFGKGGRRDA